MNETSFAVLGLGFALGVRHALDPDHLVAVSTIVSRSNSIARSSLAGTFWGIGHTASLFICGTAVLVLRLRIPESFVAMAESAVAVMLVMLGINALWRSIKNSKLHAHFSPRDGRHHKHFHAHRSTEVEVHEHPHIFQTGIRSLVVGMVHGLAGSGALMILVVATVPSLAAGLIYILLFGLGSIGGMLLLSCLISIPFALSARRYQKLNHGLQMITAVLSTALGLFWIS